MNNPDDFFRGPDAGLKLNPKHIRAMKDGKAPLEYLVTAADVGDAYVLKGGADKYGVRNWLIDKILATTYVGAMRRHLNAWANGEDLDPGSKRSHLNHIRACCAIVLDAAKHGMLVDDRGRQESIDANAKVEPPEPLTTVTYTRSYVNKNHIAVYPKTKTFGPFSTRSEALEFIRSTRGQQMAGVATFNTLLPVPENKDVRVRDQEINYSSSDADRDVDNARRLKSLAFSRSVEGSIGSAKAFDPEEDK